MFFCRNPFNEFIRSGTTETKLGLVLEPLAAARGGGRERGRRWGGGFVVGGARLVARVPHTHLVPKGHGLVRVLRCDVRHNVLQERGLLRFGEENERHRPLFRKPDYRDVIFLDVRNNLTAALRSSRFFFLFGPAVKKRQIPQRRGRRKAPSSRSPTLHLLAHPDLWQNSARLGRRPRF